MIAAINGIIQDKSTSAILIQTVSGVCYEIIVAESFILSLPEVGEPCTIYTSFIVREQEMYLIGFPNMGDKRLFEVLITAKGIGPKQGIKILSEIPSSDLRLAIISGDISRLTKIKGISAKKAEQLILDLQDKMKKNIGEQALPTSPQDTYSKQKTEVLLTMRALGYSDNEIKKPLDAFFENQNHQGKNTETLVSEFLIQLSTR